MSRVVLVPVARRGRAHELRLGKPNEEPVILLFSYGEIVAYKVRDGRTGTYSVVQANDAPTVTTQRHIEAFAEGCAPVVGVPLRMIAGGGLSSVSDYIWAEALGRDR